MNFTLVKDNIYQISVRTVGTRFQRCRLTEIIFLGHFVILLCAVAIFIVIKFKSLYIALIQLYFSFMVLLCS